MKRSLIKWVVDDPEDDAAPFDFPTRAEARHFARVCGLKPPIRAHPDMG